MWLRELHSRESTAILSETRTRCSNGRVAIAARHLDPICCLPEQVSVMWGNVLCMVYFTRCLERATYLAADDCLRGRRAANYEA